ncbi:hypothetical protein RHSIM_Rhsim04G0142100 [Rhododendron simsii]|uniref:Fatty acyl-CoA reductase n=1 Tax=Rhododendron simsii TaxID=118357 RepID=A0A834LQK7_RHOSS|nr:hypothetical protein RHSIM_Rhsim04G0142100 [Rhododendron simsii]
MEIIYSSELLGKILRAIPDVGGIYLLIKAQNKEAAKERVKHEIINADVFKCLQEKHGESYQAFMLSKLVPVVGNVCESNLALEGDTTDLIVNQNQEEQTLKQLLRCLSTRRNVPAVLRERFLEVLSSPRAYLRYDVALDTNTKGAKHLISFAKKCKELKLLLHISTGMQKIGLISPMTNSSTYVDVSFVALAAYVNGGRQRCIMENPLRMGDNIAREMLLFETPQTFVPALDVEHETKLALVSKKSSAEYALAQMMKNFGIMRANQYGWHSTYVFTKAMGEMMIENLRGDIPVVIIRPGAIESTYREPFPGWIQGNRMLDPVILGYGKGQLTGFPFDPNAVIDVKPDSYSAIIDKALWSSIRLEQAKKYLGPTSINAQWV